MQRQGAPSKYCKRVRKVPGNRGKLIAIGLLGDRALAQRRAALRRSGRDAAALRHEDPEVALTADFLRGLSDRRVFQLAHMDEDRYNEWRRVNRERLEQARRRAEERAQNASRKQGRCLGGLMDHMRRCIKTAASRVPSRKTPGGLEGNE